MWSVKRVYLYRNLARDLYWRLVDAAVDAAALAGGRTQLASPEVLKLEADHLLIDYPWDLCNRGGGGYES